MADGTAAVLAIDGGNSKTDVALIGWDGVLLAAVRGPGASQEDYGIDGAVRRLDEMIRAVAQQAGLAPSGPVARHASACLAGADLPEEEAALTSALLARGWSESAVALNDTFAVLRGGVDEPWGVAVTCGAGINCVGVAPSGAVARYLSFGGLSGDWGGSHGLARAVMWHAMRGWDGRGPATALGVAAASCFGLDSVRDVAVAVHKRELADAGLDQLTALLFKVAAGGDPVALSLVQRQAAEICVMAEAAMRRIDLAPAGTPVVLGGGVLEARDPLLLAEIDRRLAAIAPGAFARVLDVPPIAGAALLGLDQVAASAAARQRLRDRYKGLRCKGSPQGLNREQDSLRSPWPLPAASTAGRKSRRCPPHPPQCFGHGDRVPVSPRTIPSQNQTRREHLPNPSRETRKAKLRCPTVLEAKLERHRVASSEICKAVCR